MQQTCVLFKLFGYFAGMASLRMAWRRAWNSVAVMVANRALRWPCDFGQGDKLFPLD